MKVQYNGINLDIIHTVGWERTPVNSDDGVDYLYTRHTYECVAIYNPYATSYSTGDPPMEVDGSFPALTDASIRHALMQPRRQLLIVADDPGATVALQSPAPGYDIDCSNGPVPLSCSVKQMTPRTWRVSWKVRTDVIECPGQSASDTPIISNRWSQTQITGQDRRTTVVTRGVTRFRTDQLSNAQKNADFYRSQCIPGVIATCQRESIQITLNSAGDTLVWQVVDQEQFVFIGATNDARRMGVVKFESTFSTKSAPQDKVGVPSNWLICRLDIRSFGEATSTRQGLIDWMSRLAIERCAIPAGPVDPNTQALILSVETSEDLHQPVASLHITVQLPPAKVGLQGLGTLRTDFIGVDTINTFTNDGNSPQLPNDSNTRGTLTAELFANALKSACSPPDDPPSEGDASPGDYQNDNVIQTPSTSVTVEIGDNPPSTSTNYSDDAVSKGVYTEMQVESTYRTNRGVLACPIASASDSSSSSSGGGDGGGGSDTTPDVEILTLSRPMTTVEYRWEAERVSTPPMAPDPLVTDKNLVLIYDEMSPLALSVAPGDGTTPVYRIGGLYRYAAKNARKAADAIAFGVHPWTSFNYTDEVAQFPSSNFVHGIIDDPDASEGDGGGGTPSGVPGQIL